MPTNIAQIKLPIYYGHQNMGNLDSDFITFVHTKYSNKIYIKNVKEVGFF